ncbi:MAG: hypothetical protein ACTHM8_15450 [Sphingomonas sp.]
MTSFKRAGLMMLASTAIIALSACGADDVASPGTGGNVTIITNPTPTPTPAPSPTPGATITPASGCPTIADPQGLADGGTITGPTGTYRVCVLPSRINRSVTLTKIAGLLYQLPGRVDVGTDGGATASSSDTNVTLSIDPGVIIYANTGVAWLAVNRGNKINAVGTATQPIIFTSRDNVLGLNTDNSSGQWGGVVLMGRAPVTDCTVAPNATPGTAQCERQTEGAVDPAIYGGATGNDSSGQMSFVQIRYSGYVLSANNELQSLTPEGVGSGTKLDHIMSFNSSDDGAEFFGGHVNLKYFVSIGAEDDNLDTDTGLQGNFQYVLAIQRQGIGDTMIEADSDNAVDGNIPRQHTNLSNFTFIQNQNAGADAAAMLLRGGTDYNMSNGVVVSPGYSCLNISRPATIQAANSAQDDLGPPMFHSVVMQCGTPTYVGSNGVTADQVKTVFGAGSNNNSDTFTPSLANMFMNGAKEAAVAPFDAHTLNVFFDTTDHIGAVRDGNDTWYKGWTCDSATADLGNGNACTSLPTT